MLIDDIVQYDNIWHDGHNFCQALDDDNKILANTIRLQRVGWIVDLAVTESSSRGKVRFQIQALRATSNDDIIKLVDQKIMQPPLPGTNVLGPPYFGWIMPIAVRATSGHSVNLRIDLKPELIMRKLTLKTAWTLKGAYHVTSPTHLMSILKHGIVPGGERQRRLMTFFGVFPPWDERNRVTRTRSPIEGELHMMIVYIPPTELIRYGAGVSSTGDIMVPENIPPAEIREIWLARNCMSKQDEKGERRWVITRPFKIFTKQLADKIVTYADFQTFGRPGIIAARLQIINDAIRLVERFPEAPIGNPQDLEELKKDLEIISADDVKSKTLKLEDEVRCRIVSKLALYTKPSTSTLFGLPDRRCPCCLAETPSCLAICVVCNAEFWSSGRIQSTQPDGAVGQDQWSREKIIKRAQEAVRKAKEALDKHSEAYKKRIEEDEEEIGKMADEKTEVKAEPTEESQPSFAKEEPGEKEEGTKESKEDLSMFERNLTLPDEGAICVDSNLQAVKYVIVYIMSRMNRNINAWWRYNIASTREDKLANWENGFRPEVTGGEFPVKPIDPATGEPEKLTPIELLMRLRNQDVGKKLIVGAEHLVPRAYEVAIVIHKMMWAYYRAGKSKEDFAAMIRHNQRQTDLQLMQKKMLKGSAAVVEMVMVQNDQSYSTMTKLLKMATGCETFSVLSNMKSCGKHFVFDVEALVGDPMNRESDSEISLILNQYGVEDQHGASGKLLRRLKTGELPLRRQLVMNEDSAASVPQLAYDPVEVANLQAEQAERRERERQAKEAEQKEVGQPRVFNPEGYIPPKSDPEAKPSRTYESRARARFHPFCGSLVS